MGCGGSKGEVASGNTTTTRLLLRRKSSSTASSIPPAKNAGDTADSKETTGKCSFAADEGKRVSPDSPEHYFSTRKDSMDAADIVGGYHTPLVELPVPPHASTDEEEVGSKAAAETVKDVEEGGAVPPQQTLAAPEGGAPSEETAERVVAEGSESKDQPGGCQSSD